MGGTDKPFCLEVSRNGKFCAGADWYLSEIRRLEDEVKRLRKLNEQGKEIIGRYPAEQIAAQACLSEIRVLPDEWCGRAENIHSCEQLSNADYQHIHTLEANAAQLRTILEKHNLSEGRG